jgi:hypothetical protein
MRRPAPAGRARAARPHRVLIQDARGNGHHLRATWHAESRQFVVSTWNGDVCTGTARLAAADAAELAALLVDGLADAARQPAAAPPPAPTRAGVAGLVDRLRWLVQGTPPPSERQALAPVRPLRRRPG